jgi:hypothetical protein
VVVSDKEEKLFWSKCLLGCGTAKSLMNTIYYFNENIFGIRGGKHRNLRLSSFELGANFIKFEENAIHVKHFMGG